MNAKTFLITVLMTSISLTANAQLFGYSSDSQLAAINEKLMNLNWKLKKNNRNAIKNKLSNLAIKKLTAQGYDISKMAEDALWFVAPYVSQGEEINKVYDAEERILKKLKYLSKIGKMNNVEIGKSVNQSFKIALKNTGGLVDTAIGICSDKNYRMSNEERRNYLKEILQKVLRIEGDIDEQISVIKQLQIIKEREDRMEESRKEGLKNVIKMSEKH